MTHLQINGKPVARFVLNTLYSWNQIFGRGHWRIGQQATKDVRLRAEKLALKWRVKANRPGHEVTDRDAKGKAVGHHYEPYILTRPALVVVTAVRPKPKTGVEPKYDIHNVSVKAFLDGLSDAGMWPDDEWPYVPYVLFRWAPDVNARGKHFTVEIYELERVTFNSVPQMLPAGREGV